MDMLASSLTLIVKTPNQQIDDQKIEVQYGWTVKQLKKHLSEVYPSKPNETQQKLIYSGKLLQDKLTLKEVIRVSDECKIHTMHLVCAPNASAQPATESTQQQTTEPTAAIPSTNATATTAAADTTRHNSLNEDHLRQRFMHHSQSAPQLIQADPGGFMPYFYNNPAGNMSPYAAHHHQQQQQQQQMYQQASPYHMHMQQHAWMMQNLYAQRMAEYMQMTQQHHYAAGVNAPQHFFHPAAGAQPDAPVAQQPAAPGAVQDQGGVRPPPAAGDNQNVRMNAGFGGALLDDDEDELMNRDWLDWVHTICRFGVLVSIVYFYSSFMRFALVLGCVLLLYLYNGGWLRIHRFAGRNRRAPPPVVEPRPEPEPAEPSGDETDPPSESPDDTQSEIDGEGENETAEPPETTPEPAPEAEISVEDQPGVVVTIWAFVSSFFSSIIPTQPPAL